MNASELIKLSLPFIGTALGGPLGGAAASFIGEKLGLGASTVEDITHVLAGLPPEKMAEIRAADHEFQLKMAALGYDSIAKIEELNIRSLEAVNKTMQAEAASEHWPSFSWRPFIGFSFGFYITSLWILPLFGKAPIVLTPETVMAIGAILGVASWFRGQMQANSSNSQNTKG